MKPLRRPTANVVPEAERRYRAETRPVSLGLDTGPPWGRSGRADVLPPFDRLKPYGFTRSLDRGEGLRRVTETVQRRPIQRTIRTTGHDRWSRADIDTAYGIARTHLRIGAKAEIETEWLPETVERQVFSTEDLTPEQEALSALMESNGHLAEGGRSKTNGATSSDDDGMGNAGRTLGARAAAGRQLYDLGAKTVSPGTGLPLDAGLRDNGGLRAHRGLLHPDEYVDVSVLRLHGEPDLGFTFAEWQRVSGHRPRGKDAELSQFINVRLAELAAHGASTKWLAALLGISPQALNKRIRAGQAERFLPS